MGKKRDVLRILVASPSDLEPERAAVKEAVDEVNSMFGKQEDIHLELVRWETHVYPSIGKDPQDVINKQIQDDYEIFLGILWARFGTPTPRAESGTQEEFLRAKQRFQEDESSVSVMFYFKQEPSSPWEIDPDQLKLVHKFRRELGKQGIYGTFNSDRDLATNVRMHLVGLIRSRPELRTEKLTPSDSDDFSQEAQPELDRDSIQFCVDDDANPEVVETGLLDFLENASTDLVEAQEAIGQITAETNKLTERIVSTTSDLESVTPATPGSLKHTKKAINSLAGAMDIFSKKLDTGRLIFKEKYSSAIDAFEKMAFITPDFGPDAQDALSSNLDSVREMGDAVSIARESVKKMRLSIERQPRITTKFNRARQASQKALSALERELSAAETITREAIKMVQGVLDQ